MCIVLVNECPGCIWDWTRLDVLDIVYCKNQKIKLGFNDVSDYLGLIEYQSRHAYTHRCGYPPERRVTASNGETDSEPSFLPLDRGTRPVDKARLDPVVEYYEKKARVRYGLEGRALEVFWENWTGGLLFGTGAGNDTGSGSCTGASHQPQRDERERDEPFVTGPPTDTASRNRPTNHPNYNDPFTTTKPSPVGKYGESERDDSIPTTKMPPKASPSRRLPAAQPSPKARGRTSGFVYGAPLKRLRSPSRSIVGHDEIREGAKKMKAANEQRKKIWTDLPPPPPNWTPPETVTMEMLLVDHEDENMYATSGESHEVAPLAEEANEAGGSLPMDLSTPTPAEALAFPYSHILPPVGWNPNKQPPRPVRKEEAKPKALPVLRNDPVLAPAMSVEGLRHDLVLTRPEGLEDEPAPVEMVNGLRTGTVFSPEALEPLENNPAVIPVPENWGDAYPKSTGMAWIGDPIPLCPTTDGKGMIWTQYVMAAGHKEGPPPPGKRPLPFSNRPSWRVTWGWEPPKYTLGPDCDQGDI